MKAQETATGTPRTSQAASAELHKEASDPIVSNRILIVAAIAITAFLLGLIPMWSSARSNQSELQAVAKSLRPSVLQNELATAAINAHRGEFEQSRQEASSFFTNLRAELDREASSFTDGQRDAVQSILLRRDEIITLLARNDPSGADRLSELYFKYIQLKNSSVPEQSQRPE